MAHDYPLFGPLSPRTLNRHAGDGLLVSWGFDPETQRTLSRRVTPIDQARWAREVIDAYPLEMLQRGRSGAVQVRIVVGPDGAPTDCIPDEAFSTAGFTESACTAMIRYARFEPALDADGKPVTGFWATSITYRTRR